MLGATWLVPIYQEGSCVCLSSMIVGSIDIRWAKKEWQMLLGEEVRDARGPSRRRDLIILLMLAALILMAWGARSQPAGGSSADVAAGPDFH
jgi:hypothetical protein